MKRIEKLEIAVILTGTISLGLNAANDMGFSTPQFLLDSTAWGAWFGFGILLISGAKKSCN